MVDVSKRLVLTLPNGVAVYEVDGNKVRTNCSVEFCLGGHDLVYGDYIPKNEIWVEKLPSLDDWWKNLYHELVEYELMAGGMGYEEAHVIASREEAKQRSKTANGYEPHRPMQIEKPWTDAYGHPAQDLQQPLRGRPDYGEIEMEIEKRMKNGKVSVSQLPTTRMTPTKDEEMAMNKIAVAKELMLIAKELQAIEFPTRDAFEKYLKDHPDADNRNHTIKRTEKRR